MKEKELSSERVTPEMIRHLQTKEVFVFGSNLSGSHGGGAAKVAYEKFGAIWGKGNGIQGNSYGIPTMHGGVEAIKPYVDEFVDYAAHHPKKIFLVTRVGCGIAGFSDNEIAPLFENALNLKNVHLPKSFWRIIDK